MELIRYHKKYNRGEIDIMLSSTNDTIILHTDNIDRISGKKELIKLDENNLYRKRFDKPEIHIPQSGSQIIRGLNKSFPVTLYNLVYCNYTCNTSIIIMFFNFNNRIIFV